MENFVYLKDFFFLVKEKIVSFVIDFFFLM